MTEHSDRWSKWILERRDAGSHRQRALTTDRLVPVRDRLLDAAEPLADATLLDVGTGDGLIGLAALDRVGHAGRVIFSDISQPLLDECEKNVARLAASDRASFVLTDAASLGAIDDNTVDVITTRSVLIYVSDKPAAFAAFRRVLRSGGRLSLFEPINRVMYPEPAGRFYGYDLSPIRGLVDKVNAAFDEMTDSGSEEAMMGFDDRDLRGPLRAAPRQLGGCVCSKRFRGGHAGVGCALCLTSRPWICARRNRTIGPLPFTNSRPSCSTAQAYMRWRGRSGRGRVSIARRLGSSVTMRASVTSGSLHVLTERRTTGLVRPSALAQ